MTPPRRTAVVAGALFAVGYALSAVLSGHLSALARRPLLDGFAPPSLYRWVDPPPALAHSNVKPVAGRFEVKLDPQSGSEAQVLTTTDTQVSLVLGRGSIPPQGDFTRIDVTVTPLAPKTTAVAEGLSIAGNVYRIQARYAPDGPPVDAVRSGGQLVLFYPPPLDNLLHDHVLVHSDDNRTWRELITQDAAAQQQALASFTRFGYFAVAEKSEGAKKPFPLGKVLYYALIIGVVVLLAVGITVSELRRRRAARGRGKPKPKPKPQAKTKTKRRRR